MYLAVCLLSAILGGAFQNQIETFRISIQTVIQIKQPLHVFKYDLLINYTIIDLLYRD